MEENEVLRTCFKAIANEFDRISPTLVQEKIDIGLVRALLRPEDRVSLSAREDLDGIRAGQISAHEAHCLCDAFVWARMFAQRPDEFTPEQAAVLAQEAINEWDGDRKRKPFHILADYLKIIGYRTLAKTRGMEVNWPDETPLKHALGLK